MPECICVRACQIRIGKRAKLFDVGDIWDFKECPEYFRVVGENIPKDEEENIDFDQIPIEELRLLEFDEDELREYVKVKYPEVKIHHNLGVSKLIDRYVYARENSTKVEIIDNTGRDREAAAKLMEEDEVNIDDLLTDEG